MKKAAFYIICSCFMLNSCVGLLTPSLDDYRKEENQKKLEAYNIQEAEKKEKKLKKESEAAAKEKFEEKIDGLLKQKGLNQYLYPINFFEWNTSKTDIEKIIKDNNLTETIVKNLFSSIPEMTLKAKSLKKGNSLLCSGLFENLECPANILFIFDNKNRLHKQILVMGRSYFYTGYSYIDGEFSIHPPEKSDVTGQLNIWLGQMNVNYGLPQSLGKDIFFWRTGEGDSYTVAVDKKIITITLEKE